MDTANSLHALAQYGKYCTMNGLVLKYLTRNNQGRRQKNFQEGAIEKKKSNSTPRKPSYFAVAD